MGNWKCDKHGTHMDERSTPCPYCELAAEMKNAPIAWGRFAFAIFIFISLGYAWYKALVWIVGVLVKYVD